jgi:hypothetical protein
MPSKPKKKSAEKASTKRVLILRTCDSQMLSHGGFIWPRTGRVEAPDWKSTKECGNGLHGFLHGLGDGSLASWDAEAVWIAAWVDESMVIDLDGKVKFPWAEVAVAGTREEAIQFLRDNGCSGAIVGGTATAGDRGTATAGDGGTATAGYGGTATAGDGGILNIRWWDRKNDRYRIATFYVGENNIQANTKYSVDDNGKEGTL